MQPLSQRNRPAGGRAGTVRGSWVKAKTFWIRGCKGLSALKQKAVSAPVEITIGEGEQRSGPKLGVKLSEKDESRFWRRSWRGGGGLGCNADEIQLDGLGR